MKENYYKILGVSENDDDKTIKNAYRELVKRYHPDRYNDNPLADIAEEKLKKINYAYDEIMKSRSDRKSSHDKDLKNNAHTEKNQNRAKKNERRSNGFSGSAVAFKNIRILISQNKLSEAETFLSALEKNAQWHYLNGLILLRKGLYSSAEAEIKKAVKLDPGNSEYIGVLNNFMKNAQTYKARSKANSGYKPADGSF
ncbi:MAG: DnaJ domain-containing protein, partial [Oscillospiraceae bacterium]|nr:DnaJ domain-containing protein [Oscillospiraceae bacterium]